MLIIKGHIPRKIHTVVFDFDGTISTLRSGWETVMEPLMVEYLGEARRDEIRAYIDESTGIQTIEQMKWLAKNAHEANPAFTDDPWTYKALYNERLMENVEKRKEDAKKEPEKYLVSGAVAFLKELKARGLRLFAASGTDEADVKKEAAALGVDGFFDAIAGALPMSEDCSKKATLERLMREAGDCAGVLVIGDGPVEIKLGEEAGALTLGVASDEVRLRGYNETKLARLHRAGASAIVDCFEKKEEILEWFAPRGPRGVFTGEGRSRVLLTDRIITYDARDRRNLVTIGNLMTPGVTPHETYEAEGFDALVSRILEARRNGRPVIFSMGAHVIKNRLSRYLIALMKAGIVTHIASNGAGSIHDFELAYLGGTSEDVPTAIEDGSFGMWEQTGAWMNEALKEGAADGLGYGEALGRYIDRNRERFPYRDDCVLYQAYLLNVPVTYHVAIGTDIIHQHPSADFAAIGACTGVDFKKMCASVAMLDGGVFLNFGSAVIGAEVFLKALSIARNLGYPTFRITTANFDLIDLGDYRSKIGYEDPNYYYRPRKNIVNRPTSRGGLGWHFCGDHQVTIPTLYDRLMAGWTKEK